MSTIQEDFDRIALVSPDGATHNEHYHNFLLRQLPTSCQSTLEIGCGTGSFARRLAERSRQVIAIDLSPEMIRIAREQSTQFPNIEYLLTDIRDHQLPDAGFDCIASIATLHHLPFTETIEKMKSALKPGGVLLILDLFEPARLFNPRKPRTSEPPGPFTSTFTAGPFTSKPFSAGPSKRSFKTAGSFQFAGLLDLLSNLVALPVSAALRLIHQRRIFPPREVRDAWAAHAHHDLYPTMTEVRTLCASLLPDAKIKQHLLWRYSIVWKKPE